MKIEGTHNLSIISEALAEYASNIENRIINFRFSDNVEKEILLALLRRTRCLQNHIQAASISDSVNKALTIE